MDIKGSDSASGLGRHQNFLKKLNNRKSSITKKQLAQMNKNSVDLDNLQKIIQIKKMIRQSLSPGTNL